MATQAKQIQSRFGIGRKQEIILRLLSGEPLDLLAHEAGVTPEELLDLKKRFIRAGRDGLKTRSNLR